MNLKQTFLKPVITTAVLAMSWQMLLPQYASAASFSYFHATTSSESLVFKMANNTDSDDSVKITVSDKSDNSTVRVADISKATKTAEVLTSLEEMRAYVLAEAEKAGLNPKEVDTIINCESRWKDKAVGYNKNGSTDKGLWQINSIHKNISDAEKLDYKAATKWAIEKRLRDGNWSAWYCARRFAIR